MVSIARPWLAIMKQLRRPESNHQPTSNDERPADQDRHFRSDPEYEAAYGLCNSEEERHAHTQQFTEVPRRRVDGYRVAEQDRRTGCKQAKARPGV